MIGFLEFVSQSVSQSVRPSFSQSVSQSVGQSVSRSVSQSVSQFVFKFSSSHFQVTPTIINQLFDKIKEDLPGLEGNDETEQINKHFQNTCSHVELKTQAADGDSPSYGEINV